MLHYQKATGVTIIYMFSHWKTDQKVGKNFCSAQKVGIPTKSRKIGIPDVVLHQLKI